MAFTGTPVVEQLTDHLARITGITLALSAPGTIGLTGTALTDFRITITNTNTGLATQSLEIYIMRAVPFVGSPTQVA